MKDAVVSSLALAGLILFAPLLGTGAAQAQEPKVKIPEPGVPQVMTMEGRYVRAAYNNEGYAILGYRLANMTVGEKWLLLEVGLTVREGVPDFKLTREAFSLETPDGKTTPLPSIDEYRKVDLRALDTRAKTVRDSINYFPPMATQACRIGFFADLSQPVMSYNEVELTSRRGCLGRLYFPVPGGISYGQHWLNVKFAQSVVRVPFRILTKDEDKLLDKNYKSIEKQVKEAFTPKKKG